MSEAPERIWAWPMGMPVYCSSADPKSQRDATPYIRADRVDALLKAEREKALREAAKNLSAYAPSLVDGPEHDVGYYHGYVTALHRVLDLISEDKTDGQ